MKRPEGMIGLRHVAVQVKDMAKSLHFYRDLLGMKIEFETPEGSVFLTNGGDCLALHKEHGVPKSDAPVHHIGFMVDRELAVVDYRDFLFENGVMIVDDIRKHRDGAVGFYVVDPDGLLVEIIYHPHIHK